MASKSIVQVIKETQVAQMRKSQLTQARPDITVQAAVELMQKNRTGFVVLTEGSRLKGIFTEVEFTRKVLNLETDWEQPLSRFMNPNPVVLSPQDTVEKAIEVMSEHRLFFAPIVNEKQELEGVLSVRTLIRFLAEFYPTEVFNLPPNLNQFMETEEGG